MPKNHPESLKEVNAIQITDEIRDVVKATLKDIEDSKADRAGWETRIDRYRRLRYGIRKNKTHPWPNAANFNIPLIDADIQRLKPAYVNLAYATSPIVTYVPFGAEDVEPARLREELFDWRMRTKVKFFEPYTIGIDRMLEQGVVIFKIMWEFSTRTYTEQFDISEFGEEVQNVLYDPRVTDEVLFQIIQEEFRVDLEHEENIEAINEAISKFRDGEIKFEIEFTETKDNQAKVVAVDARNDLTFPVDTMDMNDARFIDYIFPVTVNDIKISMDDEKYERYPDSDIETWSESVPFRKQTKLMPIQDDEVVWLHETCLWHDINGDGIKERCIATWPDAAPGQVLRFIELPYAHGMWPYRQVKRELIGSGVLESRGIGETDADFQIGISTFFNQAVDSGTITNTPQVVYRQNSLVNRKNIRYVPGEGIEVKTDINDYQVRQFTNIAQPAQLQLTQFLKNWSDQRHGSHTSGISDVTNLPGQGQGGKKTKREIDLIASLEGQTQSLDLQTFQQQMASVYYQIDALYDQFGDETEEIVTTGKRPREISRREIQGKFDIVPNGRLDNSNPAMRLQKDMLALQIGFQSPFVKQRELLEETFRNLDPRLADIIVKSSQEVAQEQAVLAQQGEIQKTQTVLEQLEVKKAIDDTEIRKEFLLAPITGRKYAPD